MELCFCDTVREMCCLLVIYLVSYPSPNDLVMKIDLYLIVANTVVFTSCASIIYLECYRIDFSKFVAYECKAPANISNDSAPLNDTLLRLPRNISNLTVMLEIFGFVGNDRPLFETYLPIEIDSIDMFTRMPLLEYLYIYTSKLEMSNDSQLDFDQMELLKKELFNLKRLNNLAISVIEPTFETNTTNTSNNQWVLPKNLKSFGVEGIAEEYDLRECSKLAKLSVRLSNLTKLPTLHNPLPPIKVFRFDGCPLNELTVEDIAVFCLLKNLTVTSLNAPYNVDIEECECIRLRRWIDKLTNWKLLRFSGALPCDDREEITKLCPNSSLDNAMSLRKKCLGQFGRVIFYFGVAIILLPVVFVGVVTIRWCRKMYGKPHRHSSASSTIEPEVESVSDLNESSRHSFSNI